MSTLAVTPSVVQDIVATDAERDLYIIAREMERPPYWHAEEGMNARLGKALRVVLEGRLTPGSDGSFAITGSTGKRYRVTETCSCPQGQSRRTKYCLHYIATVLYTEWCRRTGSTPQGVPRPVLTPETGEGTLGHGVPVDDQALPLPPVTVEERLAAPPVPEDPMSEDADPYIPEPDSAPVAVLERPTPHAVTTRSRDAQALADSMTAWREQRQLVTQYIKDQLVENVDYYSLRIKGRDTKPTLSKAGAEKFLAILRLSAAFTNDEPTWRMLGAKEGTLCYVCTLTTREGQVVGEGRGARSISQDGGDINKAIKMSEKSALIDAVLRTGCLSDCFTQDIEDLQEPPSQARTPASAAEIRAQIWAIVQQRAPEARTREAVEAWVKEATGFALHPDNYGVIHTRLQEGR